MRAARCQTGKRTRIRPTHILSVLSGSASRIHRPATEPGTVPARSGRMDFRRQARTLRPTMAVIINGRERQLKSTASCIGRKKAVMGTAKSAAPMEVTPATKPPQSQERKTARVTVSITGS